MPLQNSSSVAKSRRQSEIFNRKRTSVSCTRNENRRRSSEDWSVASSTKENMMTRDERLAHRNARKSTIEEEKSDEDSTTNEFEYIRNQNVNGYVIDKRLGGGDNAEVFSGRKRYARSSVALKFIKKNQKTTKLIENEIQVLQRAQGHEFIQLYLGSFKFEKFHVLVLQLLHCDISSQLKHQKTLSRPNVLKIAYQTIQGLEWLENRNLVHRDIHAGNVFLDKNFTKVVLGDFGCCESERKNELNLEFNDLNHISHRVNRGKEYRFIDDLVSVVFLMLKMSGDGKLFSDKNIGRMVQKKEKLFKKPEQFITKPCNFFIIPIIKEVERQLTSQHSHPALLCVFRNTLGFYESDQFVTSLTPTKHLC